MIDLTPVRDRSGPARLLDVVPGRSKKVLKTWLSQRDQDWRGRVEVVATGRLHRVPRAPLARSSHRPGAVMNPYARRIPSRRQARPVPPPDPAGDHRLTGPSG